MKTPLTFLLVLFVTATFAQTIRRVNNNPGVTGTNIYATIQAAHDAAANGDIIYVEGSATAYGDLVCTKQLTIVGTGYLLNENSGNPNLNSLGAAVGTVLFKPGSQNSTITGLRTFSITILRVSNITITRNQITVGPGAPGEILIDCFEAPNTYNSVSNISITGNFLTNGIILLARQNAGLNYTISNLIIKSNILTGVLYEGQFSIAPNVTSATVINNTFRNHPQRNFSIWNTTFQNNIIQYAFNLSNPLVLTNSTATNNVALNTNLPNGNGNVNNIADPFVGNSTTDSFFRLKPGSAASGAGVGGTDCGAFGGDAPYVLSGIPNYPTITNFATSGTGSSATPLSVTISTKSNN